MLFIILQLKRFALRVIEIILQPIDAIEHSLFLVMQKIMKNFPAILMMKPMMKMNLLSDKQLWMPVDKYLILGPFQGHPSDNSVLDEEGSFERSEGPLEPI